MGKKSERIIAFANELSDYALNIDEMYVEFRGQNAMTEDECNAFIKGFAFGAMSISTYDLTPNPTPQSKFKAAVSTYVDNKSMGRDAK